MIGYLKKYLNKIQFYQIMIFLGFNLVVLLSILGSGLLNGFTETIGFIRTNLVYLFFWYSIPLALLPNYRKVDNRLKKAFKQLGWSGTVLMISSTSVLLTTTFGGKASTGFGRFTGEFSGVFLSATLFFVLGFFARAGLDKKSE